MVDRMTIHRKYWKTAMMGASSHMESPFFLISYLMRFLQVVVLLSIWRAILADKGVVSGMTMESVLTYTLMANVLGQLLNCRTDARSSIWNGDIVVRLLRPRGLFGQYSSEMFGPYLLNLGLFSIPLFLIAPLLRVNPLPAHLGEAGWSLLSLVLAISLGLALDFIFSAWMVLLGQASDVIEGIQRMITVLLSGALIPLALLPWGIGAVLEWLPFASTASAPLRIYTGTGDPLYLISLQTGWSLALWPVVFWIWRFSRERMASHGG